MNQHGLIRLQQMDAGGQVYDSAGSVTKAKRGASASAGQKFIANLDKRSARNLRRAISFTHHVSFHGKESSID
jgi:hypothetical protein